MLFQLGMSQYGFSKFYGYVIVKSTLLLILTHGYFSTFLLYFPLLWWTEFWFLFLP